MRKVALAALLAATITTPAFAQDTGFSGFRVEGLIGWDRLQSGEDDDDGADTSDDDGDESIEGAVFGVGAGYDWDLGGAVAGIEGEWSESSGEQESDETIDGINFTTGIETGRDLYVGGRIGFKVNPRTLIYAKGGYTNTSIESAVEDDSDRFEFDSNVDGFRLGAGAEMLFGRNMYGKVEYRYSNYDTIDFDDDFDFDDIDSEDSEFDIDLDRHQVVAGVGLRF